VQLLAHIDDFPHRRGKTRTPLLHDVHDREKQTTKRGTSIPKKKKTKKTPSTNIESHEQQRYNQKGKEELLLFSSLFWKRREGCQPILALLPQRSEESGAMEKKDYLFSIARGKEDEEEARSTIPSLPLPRCWGDL